MLYPTSYLKSKGLGKVCALVTDGRFSGGSSGLSIGHLSPEAAEGSTIGLVEEGDRIEIDIPNQCVHLHISDTELARRRAAMDAKGDAAWQPAAPRPRNVTVALKAYAAMATSAARGAVRDVNTVRRRQLMLGLGGTGSKQVRPGGLAPSLLAYSPFLPAPASITVCPHGFTCALVDGGTE